MGGIRISLTNDVTILPNAAPMTMPTARSSTFPCTMNFLNSLIISPPLPAQSCLVFRCLGALLLFIRQSSILGEPLPDLRCVRTVMVADKVCMRLFTGFPRLGFEAEEHAVVPAVVKDIFEASRHPAHPEELSAAPARESDPGCLRDRSFRPFLRRDFTGTIAAQYRSVFVLHRPERDGIQVDIRLIPFRSIGSYRIGDINEIAVA